MDGGNYNNIPRTGSPFSQSPSVANPNPYKANVNRTKTKKWVEAKVQNYDGDDWGNEYDDDDEPDEPEPALLQSPSTGGLPSTLRSVSQPAQSRHIDTSDTYGRRSFDPGSNFGAPQQPTHATSSSGASAPAHDRDSSVQGNVQFPPRKSSMSSNVASPTGDHPPRLGSQTDLSAGAQPHGDQQTSANPAGPAASPPPAGKPKFVRPSDIYRRMGEEKEKERLSVDSGRPSMDGIIGQRSDTTSPAAAITSGEQRRRVSFDNEEPTELGAQGERATLPSVAERQGEHVLEPAIKSSTLTIDQPSSSRSKGSSSPQLPDISRMSMFGDDFFSSGFKDITSSNPLTIAPIQESQASGSSNTNQSQQGIDENTPGAKQDGAAEQSTAATADASATKKTVHGHLSRPSLPGGWVSETTNIESVTPTPMENPLDSAGQNTAAKSVVSEPAEPNNRMEPASANTAVSTRANGNAAEANLESSEDGLKALGQHPTPQSLPPLKTPNPLKPAETAPREEPATQSTTSDRAPSSSVYENSPRDTNAANSTAASAGAQYSPAVPMYSQNDPQLGPPRKSTLSSVTTASPLKESDKLREEIMKTLSPAVDSPIHSDRFAARASGSSDRPQHEDRSLSGIYDDYYGLEEDKTTQETGRMLKSDQRLPQGSGSTDVPSTSAATAEKVTTIPEIPPLSPVKKSTTPQPSMQRLERRFSFETGPEQVNLNPGKIPASPAVQSTSEPAYKTQSSPDTVSSPPVREPPAALAPAPQLQPQNQAIAHQVSQMSFRGDEEIDVSMIDQPSPVSISKSATPRESAQMPVEDKVLLSSEAKPDAPNTSAGTGDEPNSPRTTSTTSKAAPKIMPFREILNIGPPQHRIQKFDETRAQFFSLDTGLADWLWHMQAQLDGTGGGNGERGSGANGPMSPTGAPASQQPYFQQYLNASNPNLVGATPAGRPPTGNGMIQGSPQGPGSGYPGGSGFNTGGQVGTKGKELLQAAGVLGNKGMKTGMKFFNKGKTKLQERGNKVFNN